MEETYTITKEQVLRIFEAAHLSTLIKDRAKNAGKTAEYEANLHEWVGYYCSIIDLDLLMEYTDWRLQKMKEEK